jgi:hypothetical protein
MIVLAYLWLLALIPLLVEKDDREVQWHAKHGLVLTVVEVVALIGLQVVVMILGVVSGGLGCIFSLPARHPDRPCPVHRQGDQWPALSCPGHQRVCRPVLTTTAIRGRCRG